jgi:hypothetical protein
MATMSIYFNHDLANLRVEIEMPGSFNAGNNGLLDNAEHALFPTLLISNPRLAYDPFD